MSKNVVVIVFLIICLTIIGCEENRPEATIIIIPPDSSPTAPAAVSLNATATSSAETAISQPSQFFVVAEDPIFNSCSCKGMPIDVRIKLFAKGGMPPYTVEGLNKTFNNSYTIPIDKNINHLKITVTSSDGQNYDVDIEIPPCNPPENCKSNKGQETPIDSAAANPVVTDSPATEPPIVNPPDPCPTKPGKPGRPDCPKN